MSMSSDEWETVCLLIDQGWTGEFTDAQAAAWRVFLADYTADQVLAALKALVARGGRFRPSVAEVVAQIRSDPSRPTFDEALVLIRHALRAYNLPLVGDYANEAQMIRARHRRVRERAEDLHPLVAAFLARRDIGRLMDEVAELDGEYGPVRRRELEAAWEAHVVACEGRDVAALVAPRRGGLARLDPLAALNAPPPDRPQIEAGREA